MEKKNPEKMEIRKMKKIRKKYFLKIVFLMIFKMTSRPIRRSIHMPLEALFGHWSNLKKTCQTLSLTFEPFPGHGEPLCLVESLFPLWRAYSPCVEPICPVESLFTLCRAYLLCGEPICSVESLFTLWRAYLPCGELIHPLYTHKIKKYEN